MKVCLKVVIAKDMPGLISRLWTQKREVVHGFESFSMPGWMGLSVFQQPCQGFDIIGALGLELKLLEVGQGTFEPRQIF